MYTNTHITSSSPHSPCSCCSWPIPLVPQRIGQGHPTSVTTEGHQGTTPAAHEPQIASLRPVSGPHPGSHPSCPWPFWVTTLASAQWLSWTQCGLVGTDCVTMHKTVHQAVLIWSSKLQSSAKAHKIVSEVFVEECIYVETLYSRVRLKLKEKHPIFLDEHAEHYLTTWNKQKHIAWVNHPKVKSIASFTLKITQISEGKEIKS